MNHLCRMGRLRMGARLSLTAMIGALMAQSLWANDGLDPSWPCIQPKVGEISIGQMWPYPPTEDATLPALDDAGEDLVIALSQRRVTEEEVKQYVADYASAHEDAGVEEYTAIYSALLNNINKTRSQIISGIARYADGQQTRAASIDEKREAFAEEEAKDEPDFDKLDALEEEIDWDERIYRDREQSLTYVCETPVILEKRAYALGQILAPYAAE